MWSNSPKFDCLQCCFPSTFLSPCLPLEGCCAGVEGVFALLTLIYTHINYMSCWQVAIRALGFEVKKADVLKILRDYDREGSGKIKFQDFSEVSKSYREFKEQVLAGNVLPNGP